MAIIIRRNPTRALALMEPFSSPMSLLDEIERLSREMWDSWQPMSALTSLVPSLDMYQDKDKLVIKTELPGVKKKDLDIGLEGDRLTIKAEKKQEKVDKKSTYYSRERSFGHYSRTVQLPAHVDTEKVSATFKKGLLEIRLPKAEEAKSQHIEIKVK
jgi:HSP20 family protein